MKSLGFSLAYATLFVLSCIMLAYVSMASYLGPFVAPLILVLCSKLFKINDQRALFVQSACQSGALFCTAIGFVLPAIFFADLQAWQQLLLNPAELLFKIFALGTAAGLLGTIIATNTTTNQTNPTSLLITTIFNNLKNSSKDYLIFFSGAISGILTALRAGLETIHATRAASFLMPTMFAIGLISGTKILPSLCIGAGFKIISTTFSGAIKTYFNSQDLLSTIQQFCLGTLSLDLVFGVYKTVRTIYQKFNDQRLANLFPLKALNSDFFKENLMIFLVVLANFLALKIVLGIPFLLVCLTIIITILCCQELSKIVGNIGLAPLGRFATFAMLGSMAFDQSKSINVFIACFCALACAAAANTVLQTSIAKLSNTPIKKMLSNHALGLVLASLISGAIFLIFFKTINFQHGVAIAQRAQMRAILMQGWSTQPLAIFLGVINGIMFKVLKIDVAMFFAGLLMNIEQTIVLVFGIISGQALKKISDKELTTNVCSGLLLGESLLIFLAMLYKLVHSW